tara:strand:- start:485 stop:841 length:357 start_codon:yes stop_codon:yes gene_type:complete
MSKKEPTKVVIDFTDNEIKSITSEHPLDVVVTSFDDDALKDAIKDSVSAEELPVIPNDLANEDDAESAGVFATYETVVDKEYVEDVHGYTNDSKRVSTYARTVLALFENNGGDVEEED